MSCNQPMSGTVSIAVFPRLIVCGEYYNSFGYNEITKSC